MKNNIMDNKLKQNQISRYQVSMESIHKYLKYYVFLMTILMILKIIWMFGLFNLRETLAPIIVHDIFYILYLAVLAIYSMVSCIRRSYGYIFIAIMFMYLGFVVAQANAEDINLSVGFIISLVSVVIFPVLINIKNRASHLVLMLLSTFFVSYATAWQIYYKSPYSVYDCPPGEITNETCPPIFIPVSPVDEATFK